MEDQHLTVALKDVDEAAKVNALNKLIENNRVILYQSARGIPIYRFQSEEQAKKFKNLDYEDIAVYQAIEESGNRGLSSMELKNKNDVPKNTQAINRIIKKLEKNGLIKSVKSI